MGWLVCTAHVRPQAGLSLHYPRSPSQRSSRVGKGSRRTRASQRIIPYIVRRVPRMRAHPYPGACTQVLLHKGLLAESLASAILKGQGQHVLHERLTRCTSPPYKGYKPVRFQQLLVEFSQQSYTSDTSTVDASDYQGEFLS